EKQLVCVDISKQSLRVARRVYHHFNERMEYLCSDAIMLPFSDGSVEGIIAGGELINHVNGEKLLREIRRVLKPRGRAVVSVAMKWCSDSLYSVSDSYLGGKIGYSMTREEATQFLLKPRSSTDVTWEVTPNCNLQVTLYSCRELQEILSKTEFGILRIESLNLLSGIVPLPIQQDSNSMRLLQNLTKMLLLVDNAFLGKIPALRWFAGNVYLVLERP
ncbi:MAG: class I SAM-dependent methyltransferase, partial [Nitrososphaeraceae archaeon]